MNRACSSGVYEIVNTVNGKRYIGSAVKIQSRWNGHRMHLNKGTHHSSRLQTAWTERGELGFEFRTLILCERVDLLMYEQAAIDSLHPEYNILRIAGSSIGRICTPETRAKIAAKAIGRKRSPESIAKGSATATGRKLAPEHAAKLIGNKYALGLKHTAEWKAQNSIRNTGVKRPKSAEYRAKISAGLTGKKASAETKAKMSAVRRGKKRNQYQKVQVTA